MNVTAEADDANLRLSIRDDGIGGADLTRGSGLIGLHDRVEALGGRVQFSSVAVSGTSLVVTIPFKVERGVARALPTSIVCSRSNYHGLALRGWLPMSCPVSSIPRPLPRLAPGRQADPGNVLQLRQWFALGQLTKP